MPRRSIHLSLRTRSQAVLLAALVAAIALLAAPRTASAGEFTITACQANGQFSSGAFENFATRDMRWRRACNPLGPGLRGLVTANVARSGRVAIGSQSAFVLSAPPETTFTRLRWSGHAQRRDCRYALQLFAERPGAPPVTIKNVRAGRNCPRPDRAQASSWPRPRAYDVPGATRIVQRVVCAGAPAAKFCSGRGQNFMQTFVAEATVIDNTPPAVAIGASGPLARGEWVRGAQNVDFDSSDNTGVKGVAVWFGGTSLGESARACDYGQRIPCPSGPGQIQVETQNLPEGTQPMRLTATDAAGNGGESAPLTVRIDNKAPGAVQVALEGGEGWRNANGFNLAWQNPPEADRAPIVGANYRICRAGTQECVSGNRAGASISQLVGLSVPGPGEWETRIWRRDAAGNEQSDNASVPVRLRFDPEPPKLVFKAQPSGDPTLVAVAVSDPISGLGGGQIELSRVGSGVWQVLATRAEGGDLLARIDDASLPPGEYQLRASAHDKAGNLASTEQRLDGQPMRLALPLRAAASLSAGILQKRKVTKTVRRGGKPHKVKKTVTTVKPKAELDFGQRLRLAGRLLDRGGNPIADAPVQVYSRPPEQPEALIATLSTGARGGFEYKAKAKSSAELRFVYAGTAVRLPVEAEAKLLVHGRSTLKVNKERVLNGKSVIFSGRVLGRPLPALGKLIELQVRLSREWSTFRTIRSGTDGRWRIRYPFKRTCGKQTYKFRARLPGEAPWPLLPGESRTMAITVKGAPCLTS